jgi:hypothetical protein
MFVNILALSRGLEKLIGKALSPTWRVDYRGRLSAFSFLDHRLEHHGRLKARNRIKSVHDVTARNAGTPLERLRKFLEISRFCRKLVNSTIC